MYIHTRTHTHTHTHARARGHTHIHTHTHAHTRTHSHVCASEAGRQHTACMHTYWGCASLQIIGCGAGLTLTPCAPCTHIHHTQVQALHYACHPSLVPHKQGAFDQVRQHVHDTTCMTPATLDWYYKSIVQLACELPDQVRPRAAHERPCVCVRGCLYANWGTCMVVACSLWCATSHACTCASSVCVACVPCLCHTHTHIQ